MLEVRVGATVGARREDGGRCAGEGGLLRLEKDAHTLAE